MTCSQAMKKIFIKTLHGNSCLDQISLSQNSFSLTVQLKIYGIHPHKNLITMILIKKGNFSNQHGSKLLSSIKSKDGIHLSLRA